MTDATTEPMPAIYLGHGAPPLLEDAEWMGELGAGPDSLPRPSSILIVSAHWQTAPMALSATHPGAARLRLLRVPAALLRHDLRRAGGARPGREGPRADAVHEPVLERETRGLDHGAWVPLKAMYPDADIPVLQMSMPDLDPQHLFEVGRRLAPLRDEGVLIVGSGFMTHGLPFVHEYFMGKPGAPQWSIDFDQWATEALVRGDLDELFAFRDEGAGDALRPPDRRALRAAVRDARGGREARRRPRVRHRGLLLRALEALLRGALSARVASCGAGRASAAGPARTAAAGCPAAEPLDQGGG